VTIQRNKESQSFGSSLTPSPFSMVGFERPEQ